MFFVFLDLLYAFTLNDAPEVMSAPQRQIELELRPAPTKATS